MFDSYGRSIDYLRVSVTDRCNLRCPYCAAGDLAVHDGAARDRVARDETAGGGTRNRAGRILTFEEIVVAVTAGAELGITKVRLTGGEPLVRRGVVELVRMIAGVPGITTVSMTTNGTLLSRLADPLKEAGLCAINVSLDTLDAKRYRSETGGRLEDAVGGVLRAKAAGIAPIKINTVVGPRTAPAELDELARFCADQGLRHQRIAEYRLSEEKRDSHGCDRPLPCEACNRLRLLSDGTIKPCLRSNEEVRFDPDHPQASLRAAIARKPERGGICTNRAMVEIGG